MFGLMLFLMTAAADNAGPLTVQGEDGLALEWVRPVSSPFNDWVNDLDQLRNGNIAASGFVNRRDDPPSDWSAIVAEIRPDGSLAKRSDYGAGGGVDAIFSFAEAEDGTRFLAGFTTRIGKGGIDGLSMLTRADGSLISERAHGAAGYDRFTGVALAPDGVVFVGHSQEAHTDKRRVYVVKTDRQGRTLWERIHDAPESHGALYVERVEGGYIVAGGMTAASDSDMFALKIDRDGRELWRKRVGTPDWDEINHGLVIRPNGDIVLVGYTHRREGPHDLVAATLGPDGEVKRLERWGGSGDDRAILARPGTGGRIWIVGHTASAGAGGDDLLLTSLDAEGAFEGGAVTVGGPADDRGTAVLQLSDGSLAIAGYSRSLGPNEEDAFVAKLRAPAGTAHPAFEREVVKAP
jgi:outer membrane protein assembly factor BamB